ncbi:hypothetical protein M5b_00217 [Klebsiella phage VLCpiM5b]|nr:hypothetical protein M5b_00217 [Klebsiella phage VLCpiM5b]
MASEITKAQKQTFSATHVRGVLGKYPRHKLCKDLIGTQVGAFTVRHFYRHLNGKTLWWCQNNNNSNEYIIRSTNSIHNSLNYRRKSAITKDSAVLPPERTNVVGGECVMISPDDSGVIYDNKLYLPAAWLLRNDTSGTYARLYNRVSGKARSKMRRMDSFGCVKSHPHRKYRMLTTEDIKEAIDGMGGEEETIRRIEALESKFLNKVPKQESKVKIEENTVQITVDLMQVAKERVQNFFEGREAPAEVKQQMYNDLVEKILNDQQTIKVISVDIGSIDRAFTTEFQLESLLKQLK